MTNPVFLFFESRPLETGIFCSIGMIFREYSSPIGDKVLNFLFFWSEKSINEVDVNRHRR